MQGGHKADSAQPFNAGFLAAEHRPPLHVAHRHERCCVGREIQNSQHQCPSRFPHLARTHHLCQCLFHAATATVASMRSDRNRPLHLPLGVSDHRMDVLEMLQCWVDLASLPEACPGASSGRAGCRCKSLQVVAKLSCRSQRFGQTGQRRSLHVTKDCERGQCTADGQRS